VARQGHENGPLLLGALVSGWGRPWSRGMTPDEFMARFAFVAAASKAVEKMKELVLEFAVQGKIVNQLLRDESSESSLQLIYQEKVNLLREGKLKNVKAIGPLPDFPAGPRLPGQWRLVSLADLCVSVTDGDHLPPPKADHGIPFLVIGNVRWRGIDFEGCRRVSNRYYEKLDWIRQPREGDILYTLVGSFGIPVVVRDQTPFCVQRHIGILRPSKHIDTQYLAYALSSKYVFRQVAGIATGIAQKTVPLVGLRKVAVPLPPLAEQKRIVAKVDELMALCNRLEAQQQERETRHAALARASLARIAAVPTPANLDFLFHQAYTISPDELRRAILTLAVQGKLERQDSSEEPAIRLLSRIGTEKRRLILDGIIREKDEAGDISTEEKPFDVPTGWEWTRLSTITRRIHYGFTASANEDIKDVRLLRITDIQNNSVDWTTVPGCEIPEEDISQYKLTKGDILVARTGGTVGKTYLVRDVPVVAVFASYLIRIQGSAHLYDRFLKLFLESPVYWVQLYEGARGAAQPNVNGQTLGRMVVTLPPLPEQHRIVAKVDHLMSLVDKLEAKLAESRATATSLVDAIVAELTVPKIVAA
jgi:type I restriction enzyme, S subunit